MQDWHQQLDKDKTDVHVHTMFVLFPRPPIRTIALPQSTAHSPTPTFNDNDILSAIGRPGLRGGGSPGARPTSIVAAARFAAIHITVLWFYCFTEWMLGRQMRRDVV